MLKYKIFNQADSSSPIVILAHGRGGNFDVMHVFKRALPQNLNVVSVQAPLSDPDQGGYCWWHFDSNLDLEGKRTDGAVAASKLFTAWLAEFRSRYGLTSDQIVALGFSQGAAMLSAVLQLQPDLLKGLALVAGFVVELPIIKLEKSQSSEVFIAHGTEDNVVSFDNAERGAKYLSESGFRVEFVSDPVAHKIGVQSMNSLKNWLDRLLSSSI